MLLSAQNGNGGAYDQGQEYNTVQCLGGITRFTQGGDETYVSVKYINASISELEKEFNRLIMEGKHEMIRRCQLSYNAILPNEITDDKNVGTTDIQNPFEPTALFIRHVTNAIEECKMIIKNYTKNDNTTCQKTKGGLIPLNDVFFVESKLNEFIHPINGLCILGLYGDLFGEDISRCHY